jgi:hypothetical protein
MSSDFVKPTQLVFNIMDDVSHLSDVEYEQAKVRRTAVYNVVGNCVENGCEIESTLWITKTGRRMERIEITSTKGGK